MSSEARRASRGTSRRSFATTTSSRCVYAFDLRSYEDVKLNAEDIYERLEDGSMPCDAEWPAEHVARFRLWIDSGTAP